MTRKHIIAILLSAALLLTVLASCSRRGRYEDILESTKDTQPSVNIGTSGNGFIGQGLQDYALPIIHKNGDTFYYDGKTTEELAEIHSANSRNVVFPYLIPTGRYYNVENQCLFYNKLTGNLSRWCADPLCLDDESCIWRNGFFEVCYVSEGWIYFMLSDPARGYGLYRCDFQRNHIELLYELPIYQINENAHAIEYIKVFCESNGMLYFIGEEYREGESSLSAWKRIDLKTKEISTVYIGTSDLSVAAVMDGDVYYYYANEKAEEQVLYKTDLSFSYAEELFTGVAVVDSNDTCMILSFYDREAGGWEQYLYRPKTQEKTKLSWPDMKNGACNFVLSGKYVYYEDKVMGDELYGNPHRDYYDFTWDDVREMGNGDLIYDENQSAHTDRAGKLYRMDIETGETACVLQLTYKGIPVRIEEFEADGEVIYFSFKNHEEFKNFYNQEFEGASEDHYAIADLQNGTVIFLEFPEVE